MKQIATMPAGNQCVSGAALLWIGSSCENPPTWIFLAESAGVVSRMVRLHLDNLGYSHGHLAKIIHANDNLLSEYYDLTAAPVVQGMKLRIVRQVVFSSGIWLPVERNRKNKQSTFWASC